MDYIHSETPLNPDEQEGLRYGHVMTRGELNELEQADIDDGVLRLRRQRASTIVL